MALQPLHKPEDLAAMLGRSKWWVCEQCRRGRFPFVRAGGSYRFTDQHVEEILTILEQTPAGLPQSGKTRPSRPPRRANPSKPTGASPTVQLKARPPRRQRRTQTPAADEDSALRATRIDEADQ